MKYIVTKARLRAAAVAALIATSGAANAWDFTQNGTFAAGTTSWTSTVNGSNGAFSAASGAAVLTGGAANSTGTFLVQQLTSTFTDFVAGYKWYDVRFDYSGTGSYKIVTAANGTAAIAATALTAILAPSNPIPTQQTAGSSGSLSSPLSSGTTTTFIQYFSTGETYDSATTGNLYLVFNAGRNQILTVDNVNVVPEPETYALLMAGLGAVGFMSRRRKYKA